MTKVSKPKRGRPVGSGGGQQTVNMLRHAISQALDGLSASGKDLPTLLQEALQSDVNTTLRTISHFLPRDVDVSISANDTLGDALSAVAARLSDKQRLNNTETIEAEYEEVSRNDEADSESEEVSR
jgi:hypothetical protein